MFLILNYCLFSNAWLILYNISYTETAIFANIVTTLHTDKLIRCNNDGDNNNAAYAL